MSVRRLLVGGLAAGLLMLLLEPGLLPAGAASTPPTVTVSPSTQTCAIPVLSVDPDFITATVAPTTGPTTAVAFTAGETLPEQAMGGVEHTVRLFLLLKGGNVVSELTGPSTAGGAQLSGPATAVGAASETLTVPSTTSATYVVDFVALFDAGIHPCLSIDGAHKAFTVTVSPAGAAVTATGASATR